MRFLYGMDGPSYGAPHLQVPRGLSNAPVAPQVLALLCTYACFSGWGPVSLPEPEAAMRGWPKLIPETTPKVLCSTLLI